MQSYNSLCRECPVSCHSRDLMITVLWQAISLQNILVSVLLKIFHSSESCQISSRSEQNLIITDASVANGYVIQ